MQTAEIRRRFLEHFATRGHTVVPSASLVSPDPSLLFTVAGMVPFIPYLTGREPAPFQRATSVQKCVRTLDIEEVGKTTRHGTFFQMNGNFSFGDYFKEGAIQYAWELITRSVDDGGLGFDPDRIWATVYLDDDEAADAWHRIAGLPVERIQRLGKKDNYWHTGAAGPGGPSSEIFYDRGPEFGPDGGPLADTAGDRFLEIWNLVFMQYELTDVRSKDEFTVVGELPNKNIDTGMGLERVAFLLQGVDNMYEIDEVSPVLRRAAELAGVTYGKDHEADVRLRVVADHVRSGLMLIGDGVTPGNEGRGYILRRLLRRAVRSMKLLGVEDATLPELLPVSRDAMSASYPELAADFDRISSVAYAEEEAFRRTLTSGTALFDTAVAQAKQAGTPSLTGEQAFSLHDTYGFPIDVTLEMAAEQGVTVDEAGFRALMAEQRDRARADARAKRTGSVDVLAYRRLLAEHGPTDWQAYETLRTDSRVLGVVAEGDDDAAPRPVGPGEITRVVLDRTPFYAESGGQVGDTGTIRTETGLIRVDDTRRAAANVSVHRGVVEEGFVRSGEAAVAAIDAERRQAIRRNHTATHLLHRALRDVLGPEVRQAGSLVAPDRLRFDFTSLDAPTPEQLTRVVERVNGEVFRSSPVATRVEPYAAAVAAGAMALFGEKYGDEVRVVEIPGYSKELCGGTHVGQTGEIGPFLVTAEGSVAAGVRRVEALTGAPAVDRLLAQQRLVEETARGLRTSWEGLPAGVASLQDRVRAQERELERLRGELAGARVGELLSQAVAVDGTQVLAARVEVDAKDGLRLLGDRLRDRVNSGVVVLGAVLDGQPRLLATVTPDLVGRGVRAGDVLREAAALIGGRGGGRPDLAEAGGKDPARLDEALGAIPAIVRRGLGADA